MSLGAVLFDELHGRAKTCDLARDPGQSRDFLGIWITELLSTLSQEDSLNAQQRLRHRTTGRNRSGRVVAVSWATIPPRSGNAPPA